MNADERKTVRNIAATARAMRKDLQQQAATTSEATAALLHATVARLEQIELASAAMIAAEFAGSTRI